MIVYCVIWYLTCTNAKCVMKFPKEKPPVVQNRGNNNDWFTDAMPVSHAIIGVGGTPYLSKKDCMVSNKNYADKFGGVKQSFTCYGREIEPEYDCNGNKVHVPQG